MDVWEKLCFKKFLNSFSPTISLHVSRRGDMLPIGIHMGSGPLIDPEGCKWGKQEKTPWPPASHRKASWDHPRVTKLWLFLNQKYDRDCLPPSRPDLQTGKLGCGPSPDGQAKGKRCADVGIRIQQREGATMFTSQNSKSPVRVRESHTNGCPCVRGETHRYMHLNMHIYWTWDGHMGLHWDSYPFNCDLPGLTIELVETVQFMVILGRMEMAGWTRKPA